MIEMDEATRIEVASGRWTSSMVWLCEKRWQLEFVAIEVAMKGFDW